MNKLNNIVLIGFKSCGKTTVGHLLANILGLTFRDLDDSILDIIASEFKPDLNCKEFYLTHGADKFREIETRALQSHSDDSGTVLATGGGAPVTTENRELLSTFGTVCYIKTMPEVIFDRFKRNKMPAYLEQDPTLTRLNEIWRERDTIYAQAADITVNAGQQSPEQICNILCERIQGNT